MLLTDHIFGPGIVDPIIVCHNNGKYYLLDNDQAPATT